jgi:hypothetical protein
VDGGGAVAVDGCGLETDAASPFTCGDFVSQANEAATITQRTARRLNVKGGNAEDLI